MAHHARRCQPAQSTTVHTTHSSLHPRTEPRARSRLTRRHSRQSSLSSARPADISRDLHLQLLPCHCFVHGHCFAAAQKSINVLVASACQPGAVNALDTIGSSLSLTARPGLGGNSFKLLGRARGLGPALPEPYR